LAAFAEMLEAFARVALIKAPHPAPIARLSVAIARPSDASTGFPNVKADDEEQSFTLESALPNPQFGNEVKHHPPFNPHHSLNSELGVATRAPRTNFYV
jgi:hypothetical protein